MFDELNNRANALWISLRLTYKLFLDARVPYWIKVIPVLTVLYIFSPLDVIPDFLIGLGQLDDLLILTMGMQLFERLAPPDIVAEHRHLLGIPEKTEVEA